MDNLIIHLKQTMSQIFTEPSMLQVDSTIKSTKFKKMVFLSVFSVFWITHCNISKTVAVMLAKQCPGSFKLCPVAISCFCVLMYPTCSHMQSKKNSLCFSNITLLAFGFITLYHKNYIFAGFAILSTFCSAIESFFMWAWFWGQSSSY